MGIILKNMVFTMFIFLFILNSQIINSQNDSVNGIAYIKKLLDEDNLQQAKTELEKQLDVYRVKKETDSLLKYVALVGSFKLANGNQDLAIKRAEVFGEELKQYNSLYIDKEVLLELAWIYDDAGYTERAYKTVEKALKTAEKIKDHKKAKISVIYHNLGYLASNLGDMALAKKQYAISIKMMEKVVDKDFESLQKTYNSLGGMMWYSVKLDSSLYYFNKAYKMLDSVEKNPMNSYYRPAMVKMNIAVLNHSLGHADDAIEASKEVISSFQKFIDISTDESGKLRAARHQLAAIDNLGSFYHSIGEFERADELITYSYNKKLKTLAPDDINITISQIISAQAKIGLRDFKAGKKLIDQAIERINNSKNTQLYWHASALSTKAEISDKLGDIAAADKYFKAADSIYRKSLGTNEYSRDFLDEMIDMSQFYAKTNNPERAISLAEESYNFIKTSDFKNTLQGFHHILNLAEVYYKLKDYHQAINYTNEALNLLNNEDLSAVNFTDSIQIQYRKPKALLINVKSKYYLQPNKSESFLKNLITQIDNGLSILNQRKEIIKSYDDLSLLITENNELFDFAKQLHLDLYQKTQDETYLTNFLTIHESSLYNRIRSRLSLKNNMVFAHIPKEVIARETALKAQINTSIESTNDESFELFFKANTNWNFFLDSLKTTYPKYYKMRYASIEKSLSNIQKSIPKNTTVIRYLFSNDTLYAVVLNKSRKQLFKLDDSQIKTHIIQLTEAYIDMQTTSKHLNKLYTSLWEPLESDVKTKKVIIIPDGELFNLSFEMLTNKTLTSYAELSTNSLLSKYIISYKDRK